MKTKHQKSPDLFVVTLPCCGYKAKSNDFPVMWNPSNKVVQCHNCGQVWVPSNPKATPSCCWDNHV